ncbi:MAG: ribonucleoside reductase class II, partial [Syntrophomonadaceae bacterium]|nr:ribonucleoside reductase class II [Syntrophomonadaceae bacterium]
RFAAIIDGKAYLTGEEGFFKTGTKSVVRLRTQEGYTLRLTANHQILRAANKTRCRIEREWVPAGQLQPGDQILLHKHRALDNWPGCLSKGEGYALGLWVGHGTLKQETAVLRVWSQEKVANDQGRSDFVGWSAVNDPNEFRLKQVSIMTLAEQMGLSPGNTITPSIEGMSYAAYQGFLRGLFDTDGTVIGTQPKGVRVRLAQSNLALLQAVQRMLLRLGIVSTIYTDRQVAGEKILPDSQREPKKHSVQAQHALVISKDNLCFFAERVGFTNREKAIRLESLLKSYKREFNRERFMATVLDLTEDGVEEVYDVQVPGVNAFDANGLYVHNCGEQPLSPGESCLLGSINLANMVENGEVNWDRLKQVTTVAVRFLDNMIDVGQYPLDFIAHHTRNTRKIGLGILGLHDLLIKCGQAYDSPEGRQLAGRVMQYIQETAHRTSEDLGMEKSVFPQWEQSIFAATGQKRRNAACITVAPTGSITVLAGAEGYGIEPIFAIAYRKTTQAGVFDVFSPLFQEACAHAGVSQRAMAEVAKKGTCQGVEGIPEHISRLFKGAQDIDPRDHLAMQIALQEYVDNAISKTINLPNSATAEDIGEIYQAAWAGNLKGITVFRDGSKQGVIEVGEKKSVSEARNLGYGQIKPRPIRTIGVTERLDTGCGKVYLTVNYDPDTEEVIETFITTGSDGGCLVYTEATSRLVSMAIRAGVPIPEIIEQLGSTHSCPSWMLARGKGRRLSPGKSCAGAIGAALEKIIRENAFKTRVSGE